jgi:hypothetical protein
MEALLALFQFTWGGEWVTEDSHSEGRDNSDERELHGDD